MRKQLVTLLMVLVLLGGFSVYALNAKTINEIKSPASQGSGKVVVNLEQAIKLALETYPGTLVKAEEEHGLYEIKIRTDKGEIIKVKVDPADGSMVSFKKKGMNK